MPIYCPISFDRLTTEQMAVLDYQVMPHAFAAQKALGSAGDEGIYHAYFAHLLREAGFQVTCEVPITLTFQNFSKSLYLDLALNGGAAYELKAVAGLTEAHANQLLNYLLLTNTARGKLLNFRPRSVESRFVNAPLGQMERRRFTMNETQWHGSGDFRDLVVDLTLDWGTALDQSLYNQAVIHCPGGEELVAQQIAVAINGIPVGNQRFQLLTPDSAFRITTFKQGLSKIMLTQFHKLLSLSPLRALHIANIDRHELSFYSILRK